MFIVSREFGIFRNKCKLRKQSTMIDKLQDEEGSVNLVTTQSLTQFMVVYWRHNIILSINTSTHKYIVKTAYLNFVFHFTWLNQWKIAQRKKDDYHLYFLFLGAMGNKRAVWGHQKFYSQKTIPKALRYLGNLLKFLFQQFVMLSRSFRVIQPWRCSQILALRRKLNGI